MKCISKGPEPEELTHYRANCPHSAWDEMKNDAAFDGRSAYQKIKQTTLDHQGGLCGYCETRIADYDLAQQVEHFHPKSDTGAGHNWALDWNNLLAVCNGGSNPALAPVLYREPLPDNLSCDQYKNHVINKGDLPEACEGHLLNPLQLAAFPNLFSVHLGTGELRPDPETCASAPDLDPNHCGGTEALVANTIRVLNLNCDRLCQSRLAVIHDIERNIKQLRQRGVPAHDALPALARRYFQWRWGPFFTVIRVRLGAVAEQHLKAIGYQG